jgi:hypothetical protein
LNHSECLWKWVKKTTTGTSLNVTCPLCRAIIDAATSEQLKQLYTQVKKLEKNTKRNREAEAARCSSARREGKEKGCGRCIGRGIGCPTKTKTRGAGLATAEEERVKQERRIKKTKKRGGKREEKTRSASEKGKSFAIGTRRKRSSSVAKNGKRTIIETKTGRRQSGVHEETTRRKRVA